MDRLIPIHNDIVNKNKFDHNLFCFSKKSLQVTDLIGSQPEDRAKKVDQLQIQNEHSQKHSSAHGKRESRQSNGHRNSIQSNDMALSDTVSNVVDFVKERHAKHRYRHNMHTRYRGSWSASSSPTHSPLHNRHDNNSNAPREENYLQYGTTSLQQRSRSPSPSQLNTRQFKGKQIFQVPLKGFGIWMQSLYVSDFQQNYQTLQSRRGSGRRLPPTPQKPSLLQIPKSNINFPELSASPTRVRLYAVFHFFRIY